MVLPTYYDHCNGIGLDRFDREPYLARYGVAKGLDNPNKARLAWLALHQVQAEFRLTDISQSQTGNDTNRVAAQADEIAGWRAKAERFLAAVPMRYLFDEIISDFRGMAMAARVADDEERQFTELGLAGKIGTVEVSKEEPKPYAYEDLATNQDYFAGNS